MKLLSDIKINDDFEITKIETSLQKLCMSHGLFEGCKGSVIQKLPFKGGLVLSLRESRLGLRFENARKIQVR